MIVTWASTRLKMGAEKATELLLKLLEVYPEAVNVYTFNQVMLGWTRVRQTSVPINIAEKYVYNLFI